MTGEPLLRSTIGKRGPAVGRRSAVVAPARPPRTPTATTSSKERGRGVAKQGERGGPQPRRTPGKGQGGAGVAAGDRSTRARSSPSSVDV